MFHVNEEKCTGCGVCVNVCPQGAISMADDKAVIDINKCTECGECYHICPQGAIYSDSQSRQNIPQNQDQMFSGSWLGPGSEMGRGSGRGRGRGPGRGHGNGRGRGRGGGGRRRQ
jgi:Fe-S-cluster-containing hydrogenase component 2